MSKNDQVIEQNQTIDLDQQIEQLTARIKELKQVKKSSKKPNGQKVRFMNKEGHMVEGFGTLYFYGILTDGTKFCKKAEDCEKI